MNEINQVLISALSTAMLGVMTAVGMSFSAWLQRRKKCQKDAAAAAEKIRGIRLRLGCNAPIDLNDWDDVFEEIRRINAYLDKGKPNE